MPSVIYNQTNFLQIECPRGGPLLVFNDLQAMVDCPAEGLSLRLREAISELYTEPRANPQSLFWMHHGFARDELKAFNNSTTSTTVVKDGQVSEVTLEKYREHQRRVEEFAFNWDGVIFSFVHLKGPNYRQIQAHLEFLKSRARFRTLPGALPIVIVPTFTGRPLPYLDVGEEYRDFLTCSEPDFRYRDIVNFDFENAKARAYYNLVWAKSRRYVKSLGLRLNGITYIGERYSSNHHKPRERYAQEYRRCVGSARTRLGGTIFEEYCFPGEFGSLLKFPN